MDNAWLDSLSEDWISQPRSGGSRTSSPPPQARNFSSSVPHSSRTASSRIPLPAHSKGLNNQNDISILPLSERSLNDSNIRVNRRGPGSIQKPRDLPPSGSRGFSSLRKASVSTTGSVHHDTVNHVILDSSPEKFRPRVETPEWKKRLLQGDTAYGDQTDLFGPAGLENIFKPPPAVASRKAPVYSLEDETAVLPSSPPPLGQIKREAPPMADKLSSSFLDSELGAGNDHQIHQSIQNAKPPPPPRQIIDNTDFLPKPQLPLVERDRIMSGQSDIRNEYLSPISVSQQSSGREGLMESSVSGLELEHQLQDLNIEDTAESEQDHPEQLTEFVTNNTDDFAHNGRFVNVARGGHSQDGSFQRRMLSSSSLPVIDESGMLQEESVQASTPKLLPSIHKTRGFVPHENVQAQTPMAEFADASPSTPPALGNSPKKAVAGSPLKLFEVHNTFTNQKLLRRLSQFEDPISGDADNTTPNIRSAYLVGDSASYTEMNEAYIAPSSPLKISSQPQETGVPIRSALLNIFGDGNLDQFEFDEHDSFSSGDTQLVNRAGSSDPPIGIGLDANQYSNLEPSPIFKNTIAQRRGSRFTSVASRKFANIHDNEALLEDEPQQRHPETPRKHYKNSESKRLPHSPLKDPTPKRRRTLPRTELSHLSPDAPSYDYVPENYPRMQVTISKKRKDAKHDDDQKPANPEVMASRQILRPRNPTPSQSTRVHLGANERSSALALQNEIDLLQQQKLIKVQAELDASVAPARSISYVGQPMLDEGRKGSVTTQDFLDEAKKIMAGIRGKARRSGLNSVEESESGHDRLGQDSISPELDAEESYQESTKEPFSRPPSREGKPVNRLAQLPENPDLVNHLRKYEEMSEFDGLITSSLKSIELARDALSNAQEVDRLVDETLNRPFPRALDLEQPYHSDPPNIQITRNSDLQRKRKYSTSSMLPNEDVQDVEFPSNRSNSSSGHSTETSIPTGSSRGSDSRRIIAADAVAHLIPDQLGGMVFDREKRIWVKSKLTHQKHEEAHVQAADDDDDPFGDIPDLTVNETQELQAVRDVGLVRKPNRDGVTRHDEIYTVDGAFAGDQPGPVDSIPNLGSQENEFVLHQSIRSSVTTKTATVDKVSMFSAQQENEMIEEFEEEISIHESRNSPVKSTPRRVTISFSSPIASIIEPQLYSNQPSEFDDHYLLDNKAEQAPRGQSYNSSGKSRPILRSITRSSSIGGYPFVARPVSRIEERDEEALLKGAAPSSHRSLGIIMSTPLSNRSASRSTNDITPAGISILELTPLSDFTMNQANESFGFEVSIIGNRLRHQTSASGPRTMSLHIKDMVRGITDIEPYEPFWEHIKEMDLRNKGLQSLHMLSKFCGTLEDLDVSDNQISQLDGVPQTIRHLRVLNNCLSDLSAWHQLRNLQYVDISNNSLTTLEGFKELVHLRGLRADHNKISSLNGIMGLDGLISLRLRNNAIDTVDFTETSLQRLTDLDLKGNSIHAVSGLHSLQSLTTLNLEDNSLTELTALGDQKLWNLKYLKLGGNSLETIDVSSCPNLRLLYLDRNRIVRVNGLLKAKHLDSLSLREQQGGVVMDLAFFNEACEVRKLFLSGNYLKTFAPTVDFLNLQYLELANCGLEVLADTFGQLMANIRVLNLNFNALRDIKPLVGIVRLKRLHVAGNRLYRLRKTTNVLAQFSSLSKVDLRNNPLTLGFYPPLTEKRLVIRDDAADYENDAGSNPFTSADAERELDTAYSERLDMETRMRRRVYEMLVVAGSERLRVLDGLELDRAALDVRDAVWDELVGAGLVDRSLEGEASAPADIEADEPQETVATAVSSERWGVEDSFA